MQDTSVGSKHTREGEEEEGKAKQWWCWWWNVRVLSCRSRFFFLSLPATTV